MAIEPTNLLSSTSRSAYPRIAPAPDGVETVEFANVAGAPELAVGTPVAFKTDTRKWVDWENGGGNNEDIIRGFVYQDAIQLHATNEVLGNIMVDGIIHYDDIVLPSGEVQANLDAALKDPEKRSSLLKVQGLASVRYGPAEA